jgi:hypothetical protein
VKFVPYNENTLSTIINKTIRFSTVYEFNDFNEFAYYGTDCNGHEKTFWEIFEEKFNDNDFRCRLLKNASEAGHYNAEYINNFKNRLSTHIKDNSTLSLKEDYPFIIENTLYSSIGIFCVSSLDVFCDDSAQLMFAHYGGRLKGLALIYEINRSLGRVEYDKDRVSGGCPFIWLKGDYSDMQNFLKKSKKWEYEKEWRIFNTPGNQKAEDYEITLRAILYTVRFSNNNIITLNNINEIFYKKDLIINGVRPNHHISERKFLIDGGNLDGHCVLSLFLRQ